METITHTATAVTPYLAHQGEARWYGDSLFEFLVPSDATGGKLAVFLATIVEGFSPPRHIHTREDEVFHVLDGDVSFDLDGDVLHAGPGTSVFVPRGRRIRSASTAPRHGCWASSPPATSSSCSATSAFPPAGGDCPSQGASRSTSLP